MKALVIGGTGPSGPYIVNGLSERGYDVTILHGGQHEVEFAQPVEHIHTDPHFAETLAPALEARSFDVVLATYGRMRIIADLLKGKTQRFIGVGGSSVYSHHEDPRWGPLGPPTTVSEDAPRCDDPSGPKFNHAPAQALADSVDWLVNNRPEPGGELERQLGDPFAYGAEDAMLQAYKAGDQAADAVEFPATQLGHMYRHPKKPGEAWAPPSRS